MPDFNLRDLLDADRDNLLDVADWLAAMPQENFDRHVQNDLAGLLDPVAHDALRHPRNLEQWRDCLHVISSDVQAQLADPARRTPKHADWRRRALAFQSLVLHRRAEADELLRRARAAKSATDAANADARRKAGERAVQRLKDAHNREFAVYLAEEYAADGISLPDRLYRHLRNAVSEEAVADA